MRPFEWLESAVSSVPIAVETNKGTNLTGLAVMFANVAVIIGFGVSLIGLAYSFIIYITSGGDPKSVQRAQRSATWSILGLLVSLAAWGIKTVLLNLLNVTDIY
ncbi:TPA: hypothetical protein DHW62_02445 [candidate division WWE3 bacterium]|uniref:Uncharacterized protein n=1 Tax=candidate division WWE3 bacterium TaxID=2053526 RepID=A0A656PN31_UNCKA|nr:hypothetical protein P147_WWE3C00001G0714 [candidate division WWE3 bacterium RAAC2_WWE3_1]KKS29430.1 MAG: hypothetical protein UU91_C0006G0083 [candidate division WWE3 bacterium GW2011_GWB1_42_117]KKS54718.1 MAG: hypothetical protein UV21_C0005G0082 [candidate division WWE3 bacterium GW2011_GWD2_42_34]KKT05417.1 MAG: hypothetical protein UV83_C0004G0049 [candidate division WWE3 bacterium GW2011_GWE2_43_18]KKT06675.1 MAG: hypothetical protein UV84_C0005G0061 [candidate division WWE3 bacterium